MSMNTEIIMIITLEKLHKNSLGSKTITFSEDILNIFNTVSIDQLTGEMVQ